MAYVIAIALSLIAFGGFLILTALEGARGARLLVPGVRAKLDARMERVSFVLAHVDWGAFLGDVTRTGIERALHDIAHGTLVAVRAVERTLTRVVRILRERRQAAIEAPRAERPNAIMRTTTYLSTTLRSARKPRSLDISPIENTTREEETHSDESVV